jgi:GAG-pre-integrase domain
VDEDCDKSLSEKDTDEGTEYKADTFDDFETFQHVGNEQVVIGGTTSTSGKLLKSEDELLQWQHRFGHMPMSRIQSLASGGILPRLSKCDIPVCAGCMNGKLTKQLWRVKNSSPQIAEKVTMPGDYTFVHY